MASEEQQRTKTGFNGLPRELKEMIWRFALRDDQPRIHFFTISEDAEPPAQYRSTMYLSPQPSFESTAGKRPPRSEVGGLTVPGSSGSTPQLDFPGHFSDYIFGCASAPRGFGPRNNSPFSWHSDNPSGYLEDGGMWTVCREWEAFMREEYEKKGWRAVVVDHPESERYPGYHWEAHGQGCPDPEPPEQSEYQDLALLPTEDSSFHPYSGFFSIEDGQRPSANKGMTQAFSVLDGDLICIQPKDINPTFSLADGFPLWPWPKLHIEWQKQLAATGDHFSHIAIEWDPRYREDTIKKVYKLARFDTVWIIDYRLRRVPPASGESARTKESEEPWTRCHERCAGFCKRHVFQGNGFRFIEVAPADFTHRTESSIRKLKGAGRDKWFIDGRPDGKRVKERVRGSGSYSESPFKAFERHFRNPRSACPKEGYVQPLYRYGYRPTFVRILACEPDV